MKIKQVAIVTTASVIVAGCAMISPLFIKAHEERPRQTVMLAFSLTQDDGVPVWCENLANVLFDHGIGASLFMVGRVAEKYPDAVWSFGNEVDVGSQTYDNVDLTKIQDYLAKLEEVTQGKMEADAVGALNSRLFRAPFGATDQDIYSLLSRAGILADFSYQNGFNVFRDGQFVKYDASTFNARDHTPDFFAGIPYSTTPVIIFFDNTDAIKDIEAVISRVEGINARFVNASELTGLKLTFRGN